MKKVLVLVTLALVAGLLVLNGGQAGAAPGLFHCVPDASIDSRCNCGQAHPSLQHALDHANPGDVVLVGSKTHWIDTYSAGTDHMDPTSALVGIDTMIDGNLDCEEDMTVILHGPVEIDREGASDDSANFPGLRPVDGHLDVIDTEIVSMSLTGGGVTLRVGVSTPGIDPLVPNTYGAIAELLLPDVQLADSFFDVWFEVDGVPLGPVYNQTALTLTAVIDQIPPEVVYLHPSSLCLPLYDDPIAGVKLYNLVEANHDTRPPGAGGIVELQVGGSDSAASLAEGSSSSSLPYALIAGIAAAAAVALTTGGWYARRRWVR